MESTARATFYLGQSLYDARDVRGALEAYTRRAEMGGWDQERCRRPAKPSEPAHPPP